LEKLFKLWLCWSGKLGFFRALLFCVAKFSTLLGVKAYCKQQGAAVNAPPALFFKGAARCGSTDVVRYKSLLVKYNSFENNNLCVSLKK
jgi:hypothetical protein